MSVKSESIRKEAIALHEQAAELLKIEKRSAEDNKKYDQMLADVDSKLIEARRLEAHDKNETEFANLRSTPKNKVIETEGSVDKRGQKYQTKEQRDERDWNERSAFVDILMNGSEVREESKPFLQVETRRGKGGQAEYRAMNAGTGTAFSANASFLVPQGFQRELEIATKEYGHMIDDCRILDTASGNPMYWPTENDTTQQATVIGESAQVDEDDLALSHVLFGAWKLRSGVVRLSLELEQDSFESIEDIVKDAFAVRWGRGLNDYFTNGTGTNQPTGILTAIAASGATAVTAVGSSANDGSSANGTNSIGYYDYVNLIHSIDPSYRNRPKTRFIFHDQVLQAARKLLDKYGRPLWQPGVAANSPDTILGYAYSINQQMPLGADSPYVPQVIAPGNTTVIFGDCSKFVIRRVKEMTMMRLVERYADFGEVGLLSFGRYDSQLVDAGTHPINVLKQAS